MTSSVECTSAESEKGVAGYRTKRSLKDCFALPFLDNKSKHHANNQYHRPSKKDKSNPSVSSSRLSAGRVSLISDRLALCCSACFSTRFEKGANSRQLHTACNKPEEMVLSLSSVQTRQRANQRRHPHAHVHARSLPHAHIRTQ